MDKIEELVTLIGETQSFFKQQAQKQVNVALTLRNWFFGFYIVEYELNGNDRSAYGGQLFKEIAKRLKKNGLKSIRERHLYICKDFYNTYPEILRTASAEFFISGFQDNTLLRTVSAKLIDDSSSVKNRLLKDSKNYFNPIFQTSQTDLINKTSFSHIIEFLKFDNPTQRSFYENETIKNSWSVRELQRAMNSMVYERSGFSKNKQAILDKQNQLEKLLPEDLFKNPYILEFLELKEEEEYTENQLEQAIINHLQSFLLEMGKGFCFESRQKRITFDNTHYYIDLVFYHRILRSNILIDLKLGEFSHADAGQMNVYLNYYNENETNEGDNPPIGIILCAGKNENLVKYATTGLSQQVFVSKYLINLPDENDLKKIIEEEQNKINSRK